MFPSTTSGGHSEAWEAAYCPHMPQNSSQHDQSKAPVKLGVQRTEICLILFHVEIGICKVSKSGTRADINGPPALKDGWIIYTCNAQWYFP